MSLSLFLSLSLSFYLCLSIFLLMSCLLITLNKCIKGHKSLGSLYSVVKTLIVSLVRQRDGRTMSPIELFWTAKNDQIMYNRAAVNRYNAYSELYFSSFSLYYYGNSIT